MNDIVIEFEVCTNCEKHSWFTMHKQKKYDECYQHCYTEIKKEIPNVKFLLNHIPSHYKPINKKFPGEDIYYDQANNKVVSMPRVGAFEIKIFDITIFSKIKSGQWPCITTIIPLLKRIIDDKMKGKSVNEYNVVSVNNTTTTTMTITKSKIRTVSPLQQRVRLKTETTMTFSNMQSTTTSSSGFKHESLQGPSKPKGNVYVRFKNRNKPITSKNEEFAKESSQKSYAPNIPNDNSANIKKSFSTLRRCIRSAKSSDNSFSEINKTSQCLMNNDFQNQSMNSSYMDEFEREILQHYTSNQISDTNSSFDKRLKQNMDKDESIVEIQVEVSVKRKNSKDIIQSSKETEIKKLNIPQQLSTQSFFIKDQSDISSLESYRTPQMGEFELVKTAQFGASQEKQQKEKFFGKDQSKKSFDNSTSRSVYQVDEIENSSPIEILNDPTVTFSNKKKQTFSNIPSNRTSSHSFRSKKYKAVNENNQSNTSLLRDSQDENRDLNIMRQSTSKIESTEENEEKKLLNQIFEYKTNQVQETLNDGKFLNSSNVKRNNSDFKFPVAEEQNPIQNDLKELRSNFIKNNSLQKRASSKSFLDESLTK